MAWLRVSSFVVAVVLVSSIYNCDASEGDRDPDFLSCLRSCQVSGCAGSICIPGCLAEPSPLDKLADAEVDRAAEPDHSTPNTDQSAQDLSSNGFGVPRLVSEPWYLPLFRWDCESECKHQCMLKRVNETEVLGSPTVKFFGKWPFTRVLGIQEPASVVFSFLNLLATAFGLLRLIRLVYFKLPRKPMGDRGPLYDFAGMFIIYGLFSLNSWAWSMIFHSRDTKFTESWDYTSAISLIAYTLILAVIRTGNLRLEAARVMVVAPVVAFSATHIFYLNFFEFDYGWNMRVCLTMGVFQLLLWSVWALFSRHPARAKLLVAVVGTSAAMLLEILDFPPFWGVLDAHSLWHAATVPFVLLWWDFVCADATYCSRRNLARIKGKQKST